MRVARDIPLRRVLAPAAALVALFLGCSTPTGAVGPQAPQWQPRGVFPLSLHHLFDVSCPTTSLCVAVGEPANGSDGQVLRSTDGGTTWGVAAVPAGTPALRGVSCPTTTLCVAIGVLRAGGRDVIVLDGSSDGGAAWSTRYRAPAAGVVLAESVACGAAASCMAVAGGPGSAAAQVTSSDGGVHWSVTHPFAALHLAAVWDVSCASSVVCTATGATASGAGWIGTTTTAGASWATQGLPAGTRPSGPITCPTATACVAAATTSAHVTGTLRTSSGGASWSFSVLAGAAAATAVTCLSASACYLVGATPGAAGRAWLTRSTDGGATWHSMAAPPSGVAVEGISCAAPSTCVTIGRTATGAEQVLLVSGRRVSLVPTSVDRSTFARSISCTSPLHCVAVGGVASDAGETAGVLLTDDAGAHWAVAPVAPGASQLSDVECPTTTVCMSAGVGFSSARGDAFGLVVRTTDGGQHWRVVAHESVLRLLDGVTCTSAVGCLAYGDGADLLRTTDGGVHWSVVRLPRTVEVLDAVRCPEVRRCLAVGSDATTRARILVSSDGGRTWRFSATLTNPLLSFYDAMSLDCPSARVCVAGGAGPRSGWLRWSDDGGARWREGRQPPGQHAVTSISCRNPTFCLGAGFGSTRSFVLRSANGGRNWSSFPAPGGTTTLFGVACGRSGCWAAGTRAGGSAELAALR